MNWHRNMMERRSYGRMVLTTEQAGSIRGRRESIHLTRYNKQPKSIRTFITQLL